MNKALVRLFAVLAIVIVSVACSHGSGPVGCSNPVDPTCNPSPTPNPNQYEPLPTERRYLLDVNGNPTHMWARLLAEPSPPRGSAMIPCPSGSNKCFGNLLIEYGLDQLPNPNTSAVFDIGFSQDGININTSQNLHHNSINGSGTRQTDSIVIRALNVAVAPTYIIVKAFFNGYSNGLYGTLPGESGITSFVVDYK